MSKLDSEIKAALEMDKHFHSNWICELQADQALQFVEHCEIYNRIVREQLVRLVWTCNEFAKQTSTHHRPVYYKIGNESSLVIYVHFDKMFSDRTEKDWLKLKEKLGDFGADEYHVSQHTHHEFVLRFWWD